MVSDLDAMCHSGRSASEVAKTCLATAIADMALGQPA